MGDGLGPFPYTRAKAQRALQEGWGVVDLALREGGGCWSGGASGSAGKLDAMTEFLSPGDPLPGRFKV